MTPLRAAAATSLLALALPTATLGANQPPTVGSSPRLSAPDKSSDLIAQFENPDERSDALEAIKAFANKTPGKVRTYLMKQVGSSDASVARDAIEAVISVGQPMSRSIKTVLETGEFKGVAIPDYVAARIGLRIDPTGKRTLVQHLETEPLTQAVADVISELAEPTAALKMLLSKVQDEANGPMAMASLRKLRQRRAFENPEEVKGVVLKQVKGLDETTTQLLVDAAVEVDPEQDYARMEAWLTSGEPKQTESALWSIGGVGTAFLDLAPLLKEHITSETPSTRSAAHWALRRFAVGSESTAGAQGSAAAPGDAAEVSEEAQTQERLLQVLVAAEKGVLQLPGAAIDPRSPDAPSVAELGEEAIEHWRFAPLWILTIGKGFADKDFATEVPAWSRDSVPSQIQELMPTLSAALSSEDRAVAKEAGLSLIEWNVNSIDLLKWAVGAVGTEVEEAPLRSIHSLLVRESEQPWLKRTQAIDALADALKNEATELPTIKLLGRMGTDATLRVLVEHFANASSTQPWQTEHYLALNSIMALSRKDREKFAKVLGRRFLTGDYRVAPMMAMAGLSAHPALEKALQSPKLDLRMIAVSVLVQQGMRGRALLPRLERMSEEKAYARSFRDESIERIKKGL